MPFLDKNLLSTPNSALLRRRRKENPVLLYMPIIYDWLVIYDLEAVDPL